MLTVVGRGITQRVLSPLGLALARRGVNPDIITVLGTLGVVVASITLVARGHLLAGAIVITLCAFADLLDGAIARASGRRSAWGAFLDSTADRVADGAVFGSLTYWLATQHRYSAVVAGLICVVVGAVVPYARARAEGLGLRGDVGVAERAERLVLIGIGGLLASAGLRLAIDVALWSLSALALLTVVQRARAVRVQILQRETAPPMERV